MRELRDPRDSLAGRWRLLDDRCFFRFTGPDRIRYLNGQVSNDVSGPLDCTVVAACLCSIKGKVEALVWIRADGDSLVLDGEIGQREFLRARLERYLIADDCEIEDLTGEVQLFHHFNDGHPGVPCRRLGVPGYDLLAASGSEAPSFAGPAIEREEWELLETVARIPSSGFEITGVEFPAELGLDEWAVDFHKGCYLGQEIVSRIRSVGKVRRSLHCVSSEVPISRGERYRLSAGNRVEATRNSLIFGEKTHVALALIGDEVRTLQEPEAEGVVEIARFFLEG